MKKHVECLTVGYSRQIKNIYIDIYANISSLLYIFAYLEQQYIIQ